MSEKIRDDAHYGCVGKEQFESFELANRVSQRRRRNRDSFKKQRPYKCVICHKWHIGTTNK